MFGKQVAWSKPIAIFCSSKQGKQCLETDGDSQAHPISYEFTPNFMEVIWGHNHKDVTRLQPPMLHLSRGRWMACRGWDSQGVAQMCNELKGAQETQQTVVNMNPCRHTPFKFSSSS